MSARATLLPFYALCDVSASMHEGGRIDALNDAIGATCDAAAMHPVVADRVRLGILTLSSDAEVVLPLCDIGVLESVPPLATRGLTSYRAGFELLRRTIEGDVAQLVGDGYRVFRPAVFFLTDGMPTDGDGQWRAALARLRDTDFPHHPNIVAFGFGESDPEVLREVGTLAAYMAGDAATAAAAIASFGTMLVESVVASGTAGRLRMPEVAAEDLVALEDDLL